MSNNFTRMSIDELTTPDDGLVVVTNCWWSVTSENEVLFYTKNGANTPQCNKHKSIAERLGGGAVKTKPVFIPIAYVPGYCFYSV